MKNKAYIIRKATDYTGVILLGFLLLLIWQLYRAPIELPFLKPYIIKALNTDDSQYQVTLDSVNMEFVRSIKPIKIIANNVNYKKNDGSLDIKAPRTSISFSIKAIFRGIIAPSSIEVENPMINIFTDYGVVDTNKEAEITQKKIAYYFEVFEDFLTRFNDENQIYAESYINDISIKHAEVEFHEVDLGRKLSLSDLNYTFVRNYSNIETDFNALLNFGDTISTVGLETQFRPINNKIALRLYFSDIVPTDLVRSFLGEEISRKIYNVNLPINGNIEALINFAEVLKNKDDIIKSLDTAIENVHLQFEGGAGNIMFSEDENYKYDISSFVLEGNLDSGLNNLKIENAAFNLGTQNTRLSFYVEGMKKLLIEKSMKDLKLTLKAHVPVFQIENLSQYWPRYIANKAWEWCKESISGGQATDADFTFIFGYDKKLDTLAFKDLSGIVNISDGTLDYLDGMPKVTNLYGKVQFFKDSIRIDADKGVSNGVNVTGGFVRLYDLDKNDNFAEISLKADSSITDALKLIDNPPLNYAKEMGLKPETLQGKAKTDLHLDFELKQNLQPEEVKVKINSELSDVLIPNIFQDKSLKASKLNLEVNNQGMIVEGDAKLDDFDINLLWNEDFIQKNYKSKYRLSFKLDDALKKKLGIESDILKEPYIKGYADVAADVLVFENDKMEINLDASLKNSDIDYSFIGFRKPLDTDASIKTNLVFENAKLISIPSFGLYKSDFNLNGKIILDNNSAIKKIDIFSIKGPKTDAEAVIEFIKTPKEKIDIKVTGNSYDLTEFFIKNEDEIKKTTPQDSDKDGFEEVSDTDVFIAVNRLWTNPEVEVRNVTASANLIKGIGINEVHMFGTFGSNRDVTLKLDYTPRPNNEFILAIDSNDAGKTLKVLRIYEHMSGGNMQINARRAADKEFVGHMKIRDFSIHNTPVLAKVLSVASFSGMVNMLTGEGIAFSHFDAPFEYKNKILHLKDSKAFGNVLGITADGYYNRIDDNLNLKGMIAPAYSLNTMLGSIPLVGNLLSGSDGTVFAANYTVTGDIDNPEVDYSPLSALSPNSLKELFSRAFGNSSDSP